ncbi:hypothetical protein D3C86_1153420 [compost metagenome]
MHGGRDLIGLDFLAVDPGTGLFGHGRQLFGGAGDLGHAVADAADQVAQGHAHARDALLQHAEFVTTGDQHVLGQVTAGDAVDHRQGFAQWTGDLARDDHGGNDAHQQCQQRADQLQRACLGAFGVTAVELDLIQLIALGHDGGALVGHFLARLHRVIAGGLVGLQGAAVVAQRGFQLTQGVLPGVGEMHVQRFQAGDGGVQLADGFLLGLGIGTGGVAAHFVARQQERFLGSRYGLELFETLVAQRHLLHAGIDVIDQRVGGFGVGTHGVAGAVAGAIGAAHLAQGRPVGVDDGALLAQQLEVFRALELRQQGLLLGREGVEGGLHVLRGGFVAVGQHVLQANHAQLGQAGVELGDVAHPVAAVDQPAQAGPAGQGQDAGQCQDQAKPQAQFQVHADVAEPAIHLIPPGTWYFFIVGWLEDCFFWKPPSCVSRMYRQQSRELKGFFRTDSVTRFLQRF